jgi:outer membrane receptor protein involved in Fe transport
MLALGVFAVAPLSAQDAPQQPADKTEEEEKSLAFTDTVVVSGSKVEEKIIDSPATISVITSDSIAVNPAQNFGDLLRSVPGVNVIQMSARDVNLTSRQATNTLSNSQLALLDGRSIYLDFFGLILWDYVPSNPEEIKQIEVVRGPASAVWGANALTGVVNIITKSPREAKGTYLTLSGGTFDRSCDHCSLDDNGYSFGGSIMTAQAPNDHWSYKLSAGYFDSDPYSRPTGTIPRIPDPRDSSKFVGGASYPADRAGLGAFENSGTSQPKVDLRVDNDHDNGSRLTFQGGYAGTEGIVHTGIGPFDIQDGSYMAYGKASYTQGGFKLGVFGNFVDTDAPNLLQIDASTGRPVQLNFTTQTYDAEIGYTRVVGGNHILSMGGNARRNNFDITIAPASEDRNEFGAYLQDEIFWDKFRVALGARVDKFGNIDDPVFSPRVSLMFKPASDHAIRVSYNKAFRSPSTINNFLQVSIVNPTDISGLAPLLPPPLRPAFLRPFPLVVQAVGSDIPIAGHERPSMVQESLTAYEVGYTGTFNRRTTFQIAAYINDTDDNINFTPLPANFDPYTPQNPPPGWNQLFGPLGPVLGPQVLGLMAQRGIFLPRTAFTYQNLGPLRNKGVEIGLDHAFNEKVTAFVNYSWQDDPEVLDADSDQVPYPSDEIALPAANRVNGGVNYNDKRFLGTLQVNYVDSAFWSDVLTAPYFGYTDSYTLVNATFGVKFNEGRIQTAVKCMNLLNQDVQQHVFGDIMKRAVNLELKFNF